MPNINFSNKIFNTSSIQTQKSKQPSFCGVTDVFRKTYVRTQSEIIDAFQKDQKSDGIAGELPPYWLAKLSNRTAEEKEIIIPQILKAFRAAINHLKPYMVDKKSKIYQERCAQNENRRVKEASRYLTKALRHFGILSDTNEVRFHKLKATGSYTKRTYTITEKGVMPSLERLFIKIFKPLSINSAYADVHGKYAELAHGLFINSKLPNKHIVKIFWGDTKANYLAAEYVCPPKRISPIVQLKKSYATLNDFAADLFRQTGIQIKDLNNRGVGFGKFSFKDGRFYPYDKDHIVAKLIDSILADAKFSHSDLHDQNAIIGNNNGFAILKLIDIGGINFLK